MKGIVWACIAPHGALAIREACSPPERSLAEKTQAAMALLAREARDAGLDALVMLTPHNVHVENHFAVIDAAELAGTLADWGSPLAARQPVDRGLAGEVVGAMREAGIPVLRVSYGGNDPATATHPMDWALQIPLHFLGRGEAGPLPVVAVSPCREADGDAHVRAGRAIASACLESGRRIGLVASADHGHGHRPNGPYGFTSDSRVFDDAVLAMLRGDRLDDLLRMEPGFVARAKADSWWQMLMLHGALGARFRTEVLSYEAPTYYGMICAAFRPR